MTLDAETQQKIGRFVATICSPRDHWRCFDCFDDCGVDYMVEDELWLRAVPDYAAIRRALRELQPAPPPRSGKPGHVLLCLPCLERRLAPRQLTLADFIDVPINKTLLFGYYMATRDMAR